MLILTLNYCIIYVGPSLEVMVVLLNMVPGVLLGRILLCKPGNDNFGSFLAPLQAMMRR